MTREELITKWGQDIVDAVLNYSHFLHGTEQEDTDNIDALLTELFP